MSRLAFTTICCLFYCSIGRATIDTDQLLNYWRVNTNLTFNLPSNHLANLKSIGVEDPNSLVIYLDTKELQSQALGSMLLLDKESKMLKSATLQRVIAVVTNSPTASSVQMSAIRLLLNYIQVQEVMNCLIFRVSMVLPSDDSDKILAWLGEISNDVKQANNEAAKRIARSIFGIRMIYATGGMASVGRDSATNLIAAIQWPLYENEDVAKSCAQIFLRRMQGPIHILRPEDFEPVMDFLLYKSKADMAYLAKSLQAYCCGDTNLASAVLWKLNESKGKSAVGDKVVGLFSAECERNKGMLDGIQTGAVKKEDAFDKAILNYLASKRLR